MQKKTMADVVAVYPRSGYFWETFRPNRPLPLGLLGALSLVSRELEVVFIDQRLDPRWRDTLARELDKQPLCVAMSVMMGRQIEKALEVSRFVKQRCTVPVVWGGAHVSLLPEQSLRNPALDMVVKGEGEVTFLELVRALDAGGDLSRIQGLAYKEGGQIHVNEDRDFLDLDPLPAPPYHLLDMGRYNCSLSEPYRDGEVKLQLETSRGCPHGCAFCYNPVYSKRTWRALGAEETLARIDQLVEQFGADTIDFVDDAFFVDLNRVEKICRGLLERPYALRWFVQGVRVSSVMAMDDGYLDLLHRAGCRVLRLGAESGSVKTLRAMDKGVTPDDVVTVNRTLRRHGIAPWFYFTCGMPGETEQDLRETIRMLFTLVEDNPQARILATYCIVPMAGTRVYEQARRLDASRLPARLEDWAQVESRLYAPWLTPKQVKLLESVFITSAFVDRQGEARTNSWMFKLLARLYRPVALFRIRRLFFRLFPEYLLAKLLLKL